jgi:hypothetical protein
MVAMTANDIKEAATIAAKIPAFKEIYKIASTGKDDNEKFENLSNALIEIDEKLVGDQITRGFNAAK